jgi:hypothetical protein
MSAAAAMRLTQLHGEPKSTLVGPAHARDGTEVPVLPWPDQTPHNADRSRGRPNPWGAPHVWRPLGSLFLGTLFDVEAAHRLVDRIQDEFPVLGEQVTVNVLGRLDLAVPIWLATWTSDAPDAMSRDAQTCRSSWAVYLTMPSW